MHPAASVILFTTLSGLGYGLLAWLGLWLLRAPQAAPDLALFQLIAGFVLSSVGLLASLAHLGHPERAWRAFSQWRSSWLSREGVLAVLTLAAQVLTAILLLGDASPYALRAAGLALAVLALGTVACTAMIYASLTPIPAWRHGLVLPVYLGFALLGGGLAAAAFALERLDPLPTLALALAAPLLVGMKLRYWRGIDAQRLPEASAALGLPAGARVGRFEAPHSEASYITREMGFALARKHGRRLRRITAFLLLLGPWLGLALAWLLREGDPRSGFALAAGLFWLGSLLERWLFFAEARHVVGVYYP